MLLNTYAIYYDFYGNKNDNIQIKFSDTCILSFLLKTSIVDTNVYPQSVFEIKIKNAI